GVTALPSVRNPMPSPLPLPTAPPSPQFTTFSFLPAPLLREIPLAASPLARQRMAPPAMAALGVRETAPGPALQGDDELLDWVKATAETAYHPVGTCKMGDDPMAVVDDQLRVHGITGLRVADASIMPTLTSGNTNAPSIMIGEKAAAMVLASVG
nr:choline dehydrogenase [Alphaproteobacteria bacterium]